MRISPPLLLLMMVLLVFAPSIQDWVTQGSTAWYRPYQVWLAVIVFVWWNVRQALKRQRLLDQYQSEQRERR